MSMKTKKCKIIILEKQQVMTKIIFRNMYCTKQNNVLDANCYSKNYHNCKPTLPCVCVKSVRKRVKQREKEKVRPEPECIVNVL